MSFFQILGKRLLMGTKILFKFLFLLPIPAFMIWFNYTVDCSGFFQGELYEREVVSALMAGENVSGYDQMNEQKIYSLYAQNLEKPFNTVAVGSSRILQLTNSIAGEESYLNCGVSGADIRDIMGMFYLFDKADMLPQNLIIGADPWLLNGNADALNLRSNAELYNEFLSTRLGMDVPYEKPDETARYKALLSPSYFQGNLSHYFRQAASEEEPLAVNPNLNNTLATVKMADGSVWYPKDFRNATQEEIDAKARQEATTFLRMENYLAPDPSLTHIFEEFIQYAKGKGVNVILVLSPYHPLVYNYASENKEKYPGFFLSEDWFIQCAEKYKLPLYGSYNPFVAECTDFDFYDGLHIKGEALKRIFPGVPTILAQQKEGEAASPWYLQAPRITWDTAYSLVQQRYEIPTQEPLQRGEDFSLDGQEYYLLERYSSSEEDAILLASYAVSKNEGDVLRFDTNASQWVLDKRF